MEMSPRDTMAIAGPDASAGIKDWPTTRFLIFAEPTTYTRMPAGFWGTRAVGIEITVAPSVMTAVLVLMVASTRSMSGALGYMSRYVARPFDGSISRHRG